MVGDSGSGGTKGLVPAPGVGDATNYLTGAGTYGAPAGGGDVTGPATSTDNEIARQHSTTGKVLQTYTSNPPTISDSGDVNIDGDLDVENIIASGNVDGRDVSVDGTKLDGIATAATKYPDTGEQAFLDADHTKLDGIATAATKYPDTGEQAFLDADHTKLDAIEASADVTDAVNVGSSIHGVANKATPVDADKVPLVDTEAVNVLKTSTWTNIKAFLKTYFDTLYDVAGGLSTHASDTSTHGAADIADVSDIAVDANLSVAAQAAVSASHTQGTDVALGAVSAKTHPLMLIRLYIGIVLLRMQW